jgi:cell volume regulation protein A
VRQIAGVLTTEPLPTALLLGIFGTLLVASAMFSRAGARLGVPVALIFLVIGTLAGSEGLGNIAFEDYALTYRIGTVALILILFDGGLNTPMAAVRRVAAPAAVLATIGVIGTAAALALGARMLGFPWPAALLLGAVVSSTDAAAVFALLRGSGVSLTRRVGATLEVESGANDPMAVILTTVVTMSMVSGGDFSGLDAVAMVAMQIAVGGVAGVAIGYAGRGVLARSSLNAGGLYAVLLVGLAFVSFAVPTLLNGSGLLAVYITGIVLGNGRIPYKPGLLRVHDALAWLSQVTMFLIMGLLAFPSRLLQAAPVALLLAALLTFVARPLVVWLCLLPFRYPKREVAFIAAVGLRGAVPIVLATFPVLAGAPGAERIFDIVFFVVMLGAIVPGAIVAPLARRLGVESAEPPSPQAALEIESMEPLNGEILSFYVDDVLPIAGERLADIPFPSGTSVTLVLRGKDLIAPQGDTVVTPGDHLYVFTREEDRALIQLMLGRPETR